MKTSGSSFKSMKTLGMALSQAILLTINGSLQSAITFYTTNLVVRWDKKHGISHIVNEHSQHLMRVVRLLSHFPNERVQNVTNRK